MQKNGGKITDKVENIVAKGEVAHDEQFLLLPQYFQKSSAAEASENICMRERVQHYSNVKVEKNQNKILALHYLWWTPIKL